MVNVWILNGFPTKEESEPRVALTVAPFPHSPMIPTLNLARTATAMDVQVPRQASAGGARSTTPAILLATALVLMSSGTALAAGENLSCSYASIDRSGEFFKRCAVREDGEIRIRRKHFKALHFGTTGMAEIAILGEGWHYVLPDGTKALMVNIGNGPDYFSEGLARTFVDGKIAYLDERLQIVLAPGYDWGWPFAGGTALVCDGCRRERASEHDEHGWMAGGIWSYIDRQGRTVVAWQDTRDKANSELEKLAIGNPGAFAFLITLDQPINLLGVQVTMTGYTVETITENPAPPRLGSRRIL